MFVKLFLLCSAAAIAEAQVGSGGGSLLEWYVWLILAIGLALTIVFILLTCAYLLYICKKVCVKSSCTRHTDYHEVQGKEERDSPQMSSPTHLHDETTLFVALEKQGLREVPRNDIHLLQNLGTGEYGPIYDGEVKLKTNVTSRALITVFQQGTTQDMVKYREQVEQLMHVCHTHVTQLFGIVSCKPFMTLFELPVNGDLKTFLISSKNIDKEFTPVQLAGMAKDVASGLEYLHSINFIHRDIAARTCVVAQNLGIKIADYGVGRYLFRSEYSVQPDGSLMPVRWMAPETLLENYFSLSSDVWSFGILLWEIFTIGQFPFSELSDTEVVNGVCYNFVRLLQPVECNKDMYDIMLSCWYSNPTQRPSPHTLHNQLEAIIVPSALINDTVLY